MLDQRLRDEVVELTRALIRIDTSNLPGNETPAAELVRDVLQDAGVDVELVARDPARANVVARIPGTGDGPSLGFVGHLDVVPADARDWTHPPFEAVVDDDGFLYGRGAIDMKNEVAARVVAMAELARSGFRPRGDLVLAMVSDEEDGRAHVGMHWLVGAMPEIRTDLAVNEGGGNRLTLSDGREMYGISLGEKGTYPVRVTARGEAGHASTPTRGDNAVVLLGRLLDRIGSGLPVDAGATRWSRPFFEELLGADVDLEHDVPGALAAVAALSPSLAHVAPALLGTTMAPTGLSAGVRLNVMPPRASMDLDCRVLPDVTAEQVEADLRRRLGEDVGYDLEWLDDFIAGSASWPDDTLWSATRDWLATVDPAGRLLPMVSPGFTDSAFLRDRLGVQAVGFSPTLVTPYDVVEAGIHNRDERIHVDDLAHSVDFHLHLARSVLGPQEPVPSGH
ncbi:MAG: M20/M25/M40 family metallo-hydrolase [Candidatus Nanopelagicales bacterium]